MEASQQRQQPAAQYKSNVREDEALNKLKQKLNAPPGPNSIVDPYLLRFLKNKNLNVDDTAKKLARRREWEKTLPTLSIDQEVVAALRSKAFVVLPPDVLRRPVLYVRMSHYRFSDSKSDQNLATVILEYLQYLCWSTNATEFVVLMNEAETGWFRTKSALQEHLLEILQKYYPELLGSLLIVNASWVVAQGVKSTVVNKSSKIKNRTTFVKPKELSRFLEKTAIPNELGGQNNITGAASEFSEQCLRYWYNSTSMIKTEQDNGSHAAGGGGGFLKNTWQPLASLVPTSVMNTLNQARNSAMLNKGALKGIPSTNVISGREGAGKTTPPPHGHHSSQNSRLLQAPAGHTRQRSIASTRDDATDDGCCSVISDGDLDHFAWAGHHEKSSGGDGVSPGPVPPAAAGHDGFFVAGSNSGAFHQQNGEADPEEVAALRQQLQHEAQRRRDLELKVQAMELGAPVVQGQGLTKLEASLKGTHEEVNALVSEVIVKGKRDHKGDPTLLHLLEMTNASLQQVIQDKPTVNAMRFAQPVDRKQPSKCSVM